MKKKLICIALAVLTVLSVATVALATEGQNSPPHCQRGGWSCPSGLGRGFMRGEDGSLLSAEDFAQRVDQAIRDGLINESERQRLLDIHQWCLENYGRGCGAARGQGRGRGAGARGLGCRWR